MFNWRQSTDWPAISSSYLRERQLVLISRALMANPELLILDEPCNGLDLFAREELLSRIGEMAHKESPTLIYVTHHTEEILPIFDHIMMLKMVKSTLLASASKF